MTEIHPDAPTVVLYTRPGCGQCVVTAKALEDRRIPFVKRDVTGDANAAARLRDLGFQSLPVIVVGDAAWVFQPVIVVGDMHWSGFQLDKIKQLEAALKNWTPSAPIPEHDGGDHA
ncbi:glutaredoxin family protein [Nocardia sp. CC227C]|uniref:glutaredoxin family protein n=1 Tax=Nocardia sp. CC227C TaxID=3044562 RepID=UPI00278C1AB4|nr:glutaredoxin family protein [Nocardia sp. CC227C]